MWTYRPLSDTAAPRGSHRDALLFLTAPPLFLTRVGCHAIPSIRNGDGLSPAGQPGRNPIAGRPAGARTGRDGGGLRARRSTGGAHAEQSVQRDYRTALVWRRRPLLVPQGPTRRRPRIHLSGRRQRRTQTSL